MVEKLVRATAVDRVASLSKWVRLRKPPVPVAAEVPENAESPGKGPGDCGRGVGEVGKRGGRRVSFKSARFDAEPPGTYNIGQPESPLLVALCLSLLLSESEVGN